MGLELVIPNKCNQCTYQKPARDGIGVCCVTPLKKRHVDTTCPLTVNGKKWALREIMTGNKDVMFFMKTKPIVVSGE